MQIDERTLAAVARLTANEKECLRRRLMPQTAKEMALALQVSPHAVEKRLKMARTKLGVSSSIHAARLMLSAEAQGLVPQTADLDLVEHRCDRSVRPGRSRRWWIWGAIGMSMILSAALAVLLSAGTTSTPAAKTHRPATPAEVDAFLAQSFRLMDRDGSGAIDPAEAPEQMIREGGPGSNAPLRHLPGRQGAAMWMAHHDADGDGRVSESEFAAANRAFFLRNGLPLNWRPDRTGRSG